MKQTHYFLLFTMIFLWWSCSESEDLQTFKAVNDVNLTDPLVFLGKNTFKIPEKDAENILNEYLQRNQPNTRSQEDVMIINEGKMDISVSSSTRALNIGSVGLYKFILKSSSTKGFALVSDDIRYPKVVAYCPDGSLSDTIFNEGLAQYLREMPIMMNKKIEKAMEVLSNTQKYNIAIKSLYKYRTTRGGVIWGDINNLPPDAGSDSLSPPGVPLTYLDCEYVNGDTTYIYKDSKLYVYHNKIRDFRVPVKWGQHYPYNKDVPYQCGTGRAPAGCVAVAIAQIMAYHKYPSNYNWNILTQNPTISATSKEDEAKRNEVARLMVDIGRKVNMNYGCSGSTSNIYKANDAFISYGYKTIGVRDYYLFTSFYNNESGKYYHYFDPGRFKAPFYLRGENSNGEGHAFVVDGLFESFMVLLGIKETWIKGKFISSEYVGAPFTLFNSIVTFHINWGWNGSSDGYYDQGDLDFNNNKKVLKVDLN